MIGVVVLSLVGVPLGLAVAIFMVELAPPRLAGGMRPAIQLLAGIPSVIYGFIGLTILAPLVRSTLGGPGLSVLTGAIILGIMILPSVIAISEDAMRAVPRPLRDRVYDAIARNRFRWFGRADACLVPTPALRERFLD